MGVGQAAATSFVKSQPVSSTDRRVALRALLSCPTGFIGDLGGDDLKAVMDDFPLPVEGPVYYCGYNSPSPMAATVTSSVTRTGTG